MATPAIRNLDEKAKAQLRLRAARNARSVEAETRRIIEAAVSEPEPQEVKGLATRIRARFTDIGGVDLEPLQRTSIHQPPSFD